MTAALNQALSALSPKIATLTSRKVGPVIAGSDTIQGGPPAGLWNQPLPIKLFAICR